jgi:GMP synthase (glutamine-hydrolysing)
VRQLFKDEVRQAGLQLGLPKENCVSSAISGAGSGRSHSRRSHPERLSILREADTIVVSEMESSDWYYRVWQSFAVLLPVRSVGVMGDQRTYENHGCASDRRKPGCMTADWVRLPYELLARHLRSHQQRSQRRQPRLLRYLEQTAQHESSGSDFHFRF